MVRSIRKLMVVGALVVAALLAAASQSEACWGWGCYPVATYYTPYYASWCGSCCYTPCCYTPCCYTSYCDPCCGGCYYPARRCLFGSYRWYYVGGCCYGGCYDSCCSTVVDSCCTGATTTTAAPMMTTEPAAGHQPTLAPPESQPPADNQPPADTGSAVPGNTSVGLPTRQNSGLLTIWVPASAKVFINGNETVTQGSRRRYVSHGLQTGMTYKYEIRAEVVRNGMVAEEAKTVYLTAGASEGVAFGFNREPSNQVAAQP